MLTFKITKCEIESHLKEPSKFVNDCPHYHFNFDKRRDLFDSNGDLIYSEIECKNILHHNLMSKECPEDCKYSHNHFEMGFHPATYLT